MGGSRGGNEGEGMTRSRGQAIGQLLRLKESRPILGSELWFSTKISTKFPTNSRRNSLPNALPNSLLNPLPNVLQKTSSVGRSTGGVVAVGEFRLSRRRMTISSVA